MDQFGLIHGGNGGRSGDRGGVKGAFAGVLGEGLAAAAAIPFGGYAPGVFRAFPAVCYVAVAVLAMGLDVCRVFGIFDPVRVCRGVAGRDVWCSTKEVSGWRGFAAVIPVGLLAKLVLVGTFTHFLQPGIWTVFQRRGRAWLLGMCFWSMIFAVACSHIPYIDAFVPMFEASVMLHVYALASFSGVVTSLSARVWEFAALGWLSTSVVFVWPAVCLLTFVPKVLHDLPMPVEGRSPVPEGDVPGIVRQIFGSWTPSGPEIALIARLAKTSSQSTAEWQEVRMLALLGDRLLKLFLQRYVRDTSGNVCRASLLEQALQTNVALTTYMRIECPEWYAAAPQSMRGNAAATLHEAMWGACATSLTRCFSDGEFREHFDAYLQRVARNVNFDLNDSSLEEPDTVAAITPEKASAVISSSPLI